MVSSRSQAELRAPSARGASLDEVSAKHPALTPLLQGNTDELDVFIPSSPNYATLRETCNAHGLQSPMAIVRPRSTAAVQAVVRFCTSNRIPFVVRSGGHSFWQHSNIGEQGIVVDMRSMDSIDVERRDSRGSKDESDVIARIGGGVLGGDLSQHLHALGLATPVPWVDAVGQVGFALGGGYSPYCGRWGLGVDNIVGARLVLASGDVADTDDAEHRELLWALRGAGNGNLGIVTELRIKVYQDVKLLAGFVGFPFQHATKVLANLREMTADGIPDNFSGGEGMIVQPPGGDLTLMQFFAWSYDDEATLEEGTKYLAKFRALGPVALDTVDKTTTRDFQAAISATAPPVLNFATSTRTVKGAVLSEAVADVLARHQKPDSPGIVIIHSAHGQATRAVDPTKSFAGGDEQDHMVLLFVGIAMRDVDVTTGPEFAAARAWSQSVAAELDTLGLSLDKAYGNFSSPDMDNEKVYGAETLERLRVVKRNYDPDNAFLKGYPQLQ